MSVVGVRVEDAPDNRFGVNDNMSQWTQQYPELLEKNFVGITRIWNKENPPATFNVLPPKSRPFHFSWRVMRNPAIVAPRVPEGGKTPMMDMKTEYESFVCEEYRLGTEISERQLEYGLPDTVRQKTEALVSAINKRRDYEGILAMTGTNVNQPLALERITQIDVGKAWNESGVDILDQIKQAKLAVKQKAKRKATDLYLPTEEYLALENDSEVIDQQKAVRQGLLPDGSITMVKGLRIHEIDAFFIERLKDDSEVTRWLLEDKVIVVAGSELGYMGISEPAFTQMLVI